MKPQLAISCALGGFFVPLVLIALNQSDVTMTASLILLCAAEVLAVIIGVLSWRALLSKIAVFLSLAILLWTAGTYVTFSLAAQRDRAEMEKRLGQP